MIDSILSREISKMHLVTYNEMMERLIDATGEYETTINKKLIELNLVR